MSLTAKEAFKVGFLFRCAEEGLTGEQIDARAGMLKSAIGISDAVSGLTHLALLPTVGPIVAGAALGGLGGTLTGTAHGHMANDASNAADTSVDPAVKRLQQAELISTYRSQTEQARQRAEMRKLQDSIAANRRPGHGI